MATIRKRGRRWNAQVRIKSQFQSKTFDSKIEAQSWAVETEHALQSGKRTLKGKRLLDAFERYATEVSPSKKGERWEVIRLGKFSRQNFATIPLNDLHSDDIQRWIDQQCKSLSGSSVRRELILISSVLQVARQRWKWLAHNPLEGVERPKSAPPRFRRISDEEIENILLALGYSNDRSVQSMRQQIAVAFLLAIETAMRQGEIWSLDWHNVDLKAKTALLLDTKNGTNREVSLSRRARELLMQVGKQSAGRVFSCNQQSAATTFRRSVRLAGIKDLTFHDTRHEAITRLARKVEVLALARIVGHQDIRSLSIYYNETASEIAERLD